MKILILGINYAPEIVGIGPYTAGMAEALANVGHTVKVVTAQPYYPNWKVNPKYRSLRARSSVEGKVEVLRLPLYVPTRPTGFRRIIHHLSFGARALWPMLFTARRFRPDVVLSVAPSLLSAPIARWAARLTKAKTWLHIQDFEIEAAFATGLMRKDSFAGAVAEVVQRWAMRGFDAYSSISPQMCRRLSKMGYAEERVIEFRNWSDIDVIRPLEYPSSYRIEWRISAPFVALYSGNIANKQGIGLLIETARLLRHRKDILFIICGDGSQRSQLSAAAADLPNVRLEDFQPKERLGELLGLADVHLLPQLAGAADLVLPSKLTNMLASGRPVLATADLGTGLAEEIEGCGCVTPPGDSDAFARAIEALIDNADWRAALGAAARQRAEQRWSSAAILSKFEQTLSKMVIGQQ